MNFSRSEKTDQLPRAGIGSINWLIPIPLQLLGVGYLGVVIRAEATEWSALLIAFVACPLVGALSSRRGWDQTPAITVLGEGEGVDVREAIRLLARLPFDVQRSCLLVGLSPIVLAPLALRWVGGTPGTQWSTIAVVALFTASLSAAAVGIRVRRWLESLISDARPEAFLSGEIDTRPRTSSQTGGWLRTTRLSVLLPIICGLLLVADAGAQGSVGGMLGAVLMISCLALASVAWFVAEHKRRLDGLREQLGCLARQDLRRSFIDPGDDEIGEISRLLGAVQYGLRENARRTTASAVAVEQTLAGLTDQFEGLLGAKASQGTRIASATQLLQSIDQRLAVSLEASLQLTEAIDASGHTARVLSEGGDELNQTSSALAAQVVEVSESLEHMVESVRKVSATTGQLAEASEETSSSMEEMASAMRAVDTSAETTAKLSRDVVDKAELGQAKVVQTIEGMEAIRDATDVAESVIRGLGARTNEIGGILDVIEDVADETNLLALNAAIIAAQAGEQGKAFSVVADEIKELADRVLASTKEIGGLIRAVQAESENAIGAIEAGSASVMSGVDLSAEAGRTLEEITEASRESGMRISEIVNSVREQTRAASHVVVLMERVRESADQIGDASGDQNRGNDLVYRSAETIRGGVEQVRQTAEAQSAGFARIRENVSGVRTSAESISSALQEQAEACSGVSTFLAQLGSESQADEASVERIREAMGQLIAQANELHEDAARFRC